MIERGASEKRRRPPLPSMKTNNSAGSETSLIRRESARTVEARLHEAIGRSWISFTLTCLTLSVLLAGDILVGLSSRSLNSTVEYRRALCEALAVQYSHLAERNHSDTIRVGLGLLIERNPQILSAAIQLTSGATFVQAGDHRRHWAKPVNDSSTIDHIQVPIFNGDTPWGTLQVAFQPAVESGRPGPSPIPGPDFSCSSLWGGSVSYLLFIKRTLRQ